MAVAAAAFLLPDWAAASNVRAAVTTRAGGFSQGGYASCNLAEHVGDAVESVQQNRTQLVAALGLPAMPRWLQQVHSTRVVCADSVTVPVEADAAWTCQPGVVCAVMTADCLPVLFCDRAGSMVAAVHAGWRGMSAGILAQTVQCFTAQGIAERDVLAWLGPAIGPAHYEVDHPVHAAFAGLNPPQLAGFTATRPGHWQLDLYAAARESLHNLGIVNITGGGFCTYSDQRLYSYRREPVTGRIASLIWLA